MSFYIEEEPGLIVWNGDYNRVGGNPMREINHMMIRRNATRYFEPGTVFNFPSRVEGNLFILQKCSLEQDGRTYKLVLKQMPPEEECVWKIICS